MPIKPAFDQKSIDNAVEAAARRQLEAIVKRLSAIGEQCVNAARNLPSLSRADPAAKFPHQPNYIDDTGNLRSSIGYVVVVGGSVMEGKFPGTGEGADKARELASKVAAQHPSGIVLIVVAGMEYAKYVSDKGYDVLDTAKITAENLIRKLEARMKGR